MSLALAPIDFDLPGANIARQPAEARGTGRDDVRLMVASRSEGLVSSIGFSELADYLAPGDALVVNTSRTQPAALEARTPWDEPVLVHIASPAAGGLWLVELRQPLPGGGSAPGHALEATDLTLHRGARLHLLARDPRSTRLWVAAIEGVADMADYLSAHGSPIRYERGPALPLDAYQTVFANAPGSAEMPSAARPFTDRLVTQLIVKGVVVLPITLHAGVSSFESGEIPGEERYEVPAHTASVINSLRAAGGRVIAVGTTVVRALETVTDRAGTVHPGKGLTDVIVTPRRGVRGVDGLVTGWHEPRSSHLNLLEAFLDRELLSEVYDRAVEDGYLWHEFGDSLLILP